jgi:hypothetical protein
MEIKTLSSIFSSDLNHFLENTSSRDGGKRVFEID